MTNELYFMYGTVLKLPCNTNRIRINFTGFHQVTHLRKCLFYLKIFILTFMYFFCRWMFMEIRGQLLRVGSPFLLYRTWELNLGCQMWWWVLVLLTEPSCWPGCLYLISISKQKGEEILAFNKVIGKTNPNI